MMAPTVRVAEIAEQVRGVSYGKDDASSVALPDYLPVLRAGNITEDGLVFEDLVYVPAARISDKQRIGRNDVVIVASSGSLAVVGKAARALNDYEGGFGAFCKVLRPSTKVNPAYFAHFFKTSDYRRRVSALAAGININNLRNEHLDDMRIPLPSLAEQRRIAQVLDRAEALRTKRRATLALLDSFTQSIFLDMFGDPASNPKGWRCRTLGDVFEIARGGSPRPIEDYVTEDPEGINWISISDASAGSKYITTTRRRIRAEGARRSRAVSPGDLLLTNSMSFGRPYIMRSSGCIHDGWLVLSPRTEDVDAEFFFSLLSSRSVFAEFARRAAGVTVKNLNIELVKEVVVPVPPVSNQRDYARQVAEIDRMTGLHGVSLAKLDRLFASLQDRAFRGEI